MATSYSRYPDSSSSSPAGNVLVDVVSEAIGQKRRENPTAPHTGGPAGNARLTAWTGLVLLVLSLAELATLLNVSSLISWHIFIGTLLLPPALLKTGSTGWRIVRYYTGSPGYHTAGPPPLLLRILGPAVVASTLGLLVSGIALIVIGPGHSYTVLFSVLGQQISALMLHKIIFVLWGVLTGLHVLGRFVPALNLASGREQRGVEVDGRGQRGWLVLVSVAAGVGTAALVLAASGNWVSVPRFHG